MSWPTKTVGSISSQIRGVTYDKSEASKLPAPGLTPILRANNITDSGLAFEDLVYVPQRRVSPKQLLQNGDVVIAASSGSLSVVGKAARLKEPFDGSFGAFCKVLRPHDGVDPSYFAHFFQTQSYRKRISSLAAGANINNLKNEHLDELEIPLPPLEEQRRIAASLDQAEELRAKRRAALALLDQLPQAIFLDLFGDPATNPKNWPKKQIKDLGRVVTGNTPSRAVAQYYGEGIEWIKSDNILNESQVLTSSAEHLSPAGRSVARVAPVGSVLITCIAGSPDSIGKCAIANREVAFNQQINAIIPINLDVNFLYYLIRVGKKLVQEASTNSMKGMVSKSKLEAVQLICPPLDLQRKFASYVDTIHRTKSTFRSGLAEIDTLSASLQAIAFGGRNG